MLSRAVTALGITQIVGWGSTYYSSAVLFAPMAEDTGWSITLVFGAFSWAMLLSGLVSRRVGELAEQHGERRVMTAGSIAIVAGLLLIASARHPLQLVLAWTLLGVAMRASLYESAFSALARLAGSGARRAISVVTLWGGLASTVFWPLGHWLVGQWGWRITFVVYAALNLLLCVPLHHRFLAAIRPREPDRATGANPPGSADGSARAAADSLDRGSLPEALRPRALLALSGLLAAHSFVFGALSAHLPRLLEALGLAAAAAIALASMKGVAQVAARFVELSLQRVLGPIAVGLIATAMLPFGLLVMDLSAPQLAMVSVGCMIYGASNGLITIVRGSVTLQMFGHAGYAATLGRVAAPGLIAGAIAPMSHAALIERFGHAIALEVLTALAMLGFAGMLWLGAIQKRSARNTPTSAR